MTHDESISRRRFFGISAGMAAAAGLKPWPLPAMGRKPGIPIAVQLYTVRQELEKDFFGTLRAIGNMGYDGVELWKFFDHSARDIRNCLDDCGLVPAGAHTDLNTVQGDTLMETIAFHQILGNHTLIVPWLPEEMRNSKEAWLKTADFFNELSERAAAEGFRIGYHNHAMEFEPMDGEMPWDIFARSTRKEVILQFDTGNAAVKDIDPLPFLKRYPGRAVTIHLKEYSKSNPSALIGEGDIPFEAIIRFCRTAGGTEWFILEEEKDAYPPLVGAEKSLLNFRTILKKA